MQAEKLPDGDPVWATEAELLAQGLLAIAAVAMPNTIVLGGGVMQHAGLREAVARRLAELNGGFAPLPEVVAPALGEDSALSGALELAARALGDSPPHRRTQNR
jgi:predicted NBD/HSP70 family sugar kinase